jgi:hypothetical protein
MTPEDKAEQLVESFMLWKFQKCELTKKQAKQCALIAVDEILKVAFYSTDEIYNFYIEVKQEIENL